MLHRRTRSVFAPSCVAVAAVIAIPANSFAQTFRGGINGTVTDQSGAVVPGATVEAIDTATGVSHKTSLLERRRVYLSGYAARRLQREGVKASGFQSTLVTKVPVTAGVIYTLPVKAFHRRRPVKRLKCLLRAWRSIPPPPRRRQIFPKRQCRTFR